MNITDLPATDAPLTILCHHGDVNVVNDDPGTVSITPHDTMAMASNIDAEAWTWLRKTPEFMRLLRCVFPEKDFPESGFSPKLAMHGSGMRHTVGLILLLKKAAATGQRAFVQYPESFLHPAQQLGLADLFITLGVNPESAS